ncbi:hypothetical protein I552_0076 [Mycobacterium xenopi 3993]|nr:hypothetical protein I552_0076 [Mycobacterium xenopi 3993]
MAAERRRGPLGDPRTPGSAWVTDRRDHPDVAGVTGNAANGSTAASQPAPRCRARPARRPAEPPVMPRGGTAMSWGYGESSQRPATQRTTAPRGFAGAVRAAT